MAGFWGGFAEGLNDELDRGQRRREFEETLHQRWLETLAQVAASRQASDIDSYDPGFADTPEEVMDTSTSGPVEDTGVVDTGAEPTTEPTTTEVAAEPTEVLTETEAPETPTVGSLPDNADAYMQALVYMGADPEQVAKIGAYGKKALKLTYEQLSKGRPKSGWTKTLLTEALDSAIVDVKVGKRPDLQKLWRDLYPEAGELSSEDEKYVSTLLGNPATSVNVLIPWFDTYVEPEKAKPLTQAEKDGIRDDMRDEVSGAIQSQIADMQEIIQAGGEGAQEAAARLQVLERALTRVDEYSDIGAGLRAIGEEEADLLFSGFFRTYPTLLEDNYFLGNNLDPYAKRYLERRDNPQGEPVEPALEEPVGPQTKNFPTVGSEEEAQNMINNGQLKAGDFFILNGQVQVVE